MKNSHLLLLLSFSFSLISCNFNSFNKAYVSPTPMLSDLRPYEINAKAMIGFADLELQAAGALNNHIGLSTNLLLSFTGHYVHEAGVVYFIRREYNYFELSSGFGFGRINSTVTAVPFEPFAIPGLGTDSYYFHSIKASYLNFYLQPSFSFQATSRFHLGFTCKASPAYFLNYDYDYYLDSYSGSGYRGVLDQDRIQFKNKMNINLHPLITLKRMNRPGSKSSLFVQVGASFSTLLARSLTQQENYPHGLGPYKEFEHPAQRRYLFAFGYERRF